MVLTASRFSSISVSIVIPVYNGLAYTRECLRALREHTPGAHEVLVVDNASNDGTPEYLKTIPGISVIRNNTNLGFARACNAGALLAKGGYLLFLNNDTVPQPGWLPPLLETIENREKAGVVGSRLLYPGSGTVQHAGVCFGVNGQSYHIFRYHDGGAPEVVCEREMQAVTGACLLTRRDLFFAADGFDEGYLNGYEDFDYCFAVRKLGWKVFYNGTSVLHHHESVSEGRCNSARERTNLERFFSRWGSTVWVDNPSEYIPAFARNRLLRRFAPGSEGIFHGTGVMEGDWLVCRPGEHARGYCVLGPGMYVLASQRLLATFHLSVAENAPAAARAVSLDVHARWCRKILCRCDVTVAQIRQGGGEVSLVLPVARGQDLEFRVYWHGDVEVGFSHVTAVMAGISAGTSAAPEIP